MDFLLVIYYLGWAVTAGIFLVRLLFGGHRFRWEHFLYMAIWPVALALFLVGVNRAAKKLEEDERRAREKMRAARKIHSYQDEREEERRQREAERYEKRASWERERMQATIDSGFCCWCGMPLEGSTERCGNCGKGLTLPPVA